MSSKRQTNLFFARKIAILGACEVVYLEGASISTGSVCRTYGVSHSIVLSNSGVTREPALMARVLAHKITALAFHEVRLHSEDLSARFMGLKTIHPRYIRGSTLLFVLLLATHF